MKMMLKNFYNFSGACVCAGNTNMACGSNADRCERYLSTYTANAKGSEVKKKFMDYGSFN